MWRTDERKLQTTMTAQTDFPTQRRWKVKALALSGFQGVFLVRRSRRPLTPVGSEENGLAPHRPPKLMQPEQGHPGAVDCPAAPRHLSDPGELHFLGFLNTKTTLFSPASPSFPLSLTPPPPPPLFSVPLLSPTDAAFTDSRTKGNSTSEAHRQNRSMK